MATPLIRKSGSISGLSTPGQGADDLVPGEVVTLSDQEGANSGATYVWTLLDTPVGSSVTLVNPTSPSPFFTVPASITVATGSFLVRCVVNGSDESVEVFAVPLPNTGARIPAFSEEAIYDEAGNVKGWHPALALFMRTTDLQLPTANEKAALVGAVSETLARTLWIGGRESYGDVGSDTPLVVGAIALNPSQYALTGTTLALVFRALAAVGDAGVTAHVELFNVTDNESIAVLNVTSTTVTKLEAALTVGAGAGQIDNSEKIYEARVFVDSPADASDSIELYTAEIRIVNTIA